MHVEAQTTVDRPRAEVFDDLAHAEHLPDYVSDFEWVKRKGNAKALERLKRRLEGGG